MGDVQGFDPPSTSFARESHLMRGSGSFLVRLAKMLDLDHADLETLTELATALEHAGFPADTIDSPHAGTITLSELEAVLRAVEWGGARLSEERVVAALGLNAADESGTVSLGSTRSGIGGFLSWPRPHCLPFRTLLCHPKLQPVLETILGRGYRLDHGPGLFISQQGDDGLVLHGGAHEVFTQEGFAEGYHFHAGHFYTGLVVAEVMLADEGPGDVSDTRTRTVQGSAAALPAER